MSETEERPSKIRRITRSDDSSEHEVSLDPSPAVPSTEISDPVDHEGENAGNEALGDGQEEPVLSKRAKKKLAKREAWAAGTDERRAKRREKAKDRKVRKAEQKAAQGPVPEPVKTVLRRPLQTPVGLILDCQFDEYMTDKELVSLGAQLTRSYSDNRTSPYRSHLVVSSWGGRLKHRFETVLSNNQLGWKGVTFTEGDFVQAATELHPIMKGPEGGKLVGAFAPLEPSKGENTSKRAKKNSIVDADVAKSEAATNSETQEASEKPETIPSEAETTTSTPSIVYLTADSENTIDRLSPYTTYIVGGIVDKNRHKNLCQTIASRHGIPTAKLPIGEYMTMQSRSVLAVNHVVEIMLKWLETGDWGEAFLSVIPKRKEAKLKKPRNSDEGKNEDEPEGEGDKEDDQANGDPDESLDEGDDSNGDTE